MHSLRVGAKDAVAGTESSGSVPHAARNGSSPLP
jgi:hypothetical protein